MSAQKKDKGLLEQGVVSEQAMMAYLDNKLTPEEKQRFEQLLERDPFVREALEGMQLRPDSTVLSASITSLNKKVRERSGLKESKPFNLHWSNYAWAAVVLGVLVGIGVVMVGFLGNSSEPISMEQQIKQAPPAAPDLIQAEGAADNAGILSEAPVLETETVNSSSTTVGSLEPNENIVLEDGNVAPQKQELTSADFKVTVTDARLAAHEKLLEKPAESKTTMQKNLAVETVTATETKKAKSESAAKEDNAEAPAATQRVIRGAIMEKEELDRVTVVTLDDAMKNFNSGNYKKAAEMFDAIAKEQPSNAEALYYGGISDYIVGNDKRSERNFDKLLKNGSKYIDGSKWYKANLLLKKGKKADAFKLLNELSESNSSYKERAIKKKEEIKF